MTDLDAAAAQLEDAKLHLRNTLLLAAQYVEHRAASGDPEAADLARQIAAAFDRSKLAGIVGATAIKENHHDR